MPIARLLRTRIKCRARIADDDWEECNDSSQRADGDAMMETKLLLQKIAALRMRLDEDQAPAVAVEDPVRVLEHKVQKGALHNRLIENALKTAEPAEATQSEQIPTRLSARGA